MVFRHAAAMLSSAQLPTDTRAATRDEGLDVLRGLAVLLVVLFHIQLRLPFETTAIGRLMPREAFNVLFRSGYYAVILFFVVSGYLITTASLQRWGDLGRVRPGPFYALRLARIAPCLAALLILLAGLHALGVDGFVVSTVALGRALFAAATLHLNWLEARTGYLPGAWDVLWSLSVEEGFYLLFPLVCRLPRRQARLAVLVLFIMAGPLARVAFTDNEIWADKSYLSGADAIAFGCLAALARGRIAGDRRLARACLVLGAVLVAFVFVFRREAAALGLVATGLNVTALAAGLALILAARRGRQGPRGVSATRLVAPIRALGRNSYEVYLCHMLVITPLAPRLAGLGPPDLAVPIGFAVLVLLSGGLGAIVARGLSEPANRIIRGWLAPATGCAVCRLDPPGMVGPHKPPK